MMELERWIKGQQQELRQENEWLKAIEKLARAARQRVVENKTAVALLKAELAESRAQRCRVSPVSSRGCERGTKGCDVVHDEAKARERIAGLETECDALDVLLAELRADLAGVCQERDRLRAECERLKAALARAHERPWRGMAEEAYAANERLHARVAELEQSERVLLQRCDQLEAHRNREAARVAELEAELAEARAQRDAAEEFADAQTVRLAQASTAIATLEEENAARAEYEAAQLKTQVMQLTALTQHQRRHMAEAGTIEAADACGAEIVEARSRVAELEQSERVLLQRCDQLEAHRNREAARVRVLEAELAEARAQRALQLGYPGLGGVEGGAEVDEAHLAKVEREHAPCLCGLEPRVLCRNCEVRAVVAELRRLRDAKERGE